MWLLSWVGMLLYYKIIMRKLLPSKRLFYVPVREEFVIRCTSTVMTLVFQFCMSLLWNDVILMGLPYFLVEMCNLILGIFFNLEFLKWLCPLSHVAALNINPRKWRSRQWSVSESVTQRRHSALDWTPLQLVIWDSVRRLTNPLCCL